MKHSGAVRRERPGEIVGTCFVWHTVHRIYSSIKRKNVFSLGEESILYLPLWVTLLSCERPGYLANSDAKKTKLSHWGERAPAYF